MIEYTRDGDVAGGSGQSASDQGQRQSATEFVVTEVTEHNVQDVLQASLQQPLVLYCWSDRITESAENVQKMKRLLSRFGGRIAMATLNCDAHSMIAQQLGALRLPVAKVIMQGQILAEVTGQEPEEQLLGLFSQVGGEPGEEIDGTVVETDAASDEVDRVLWSVEQAIQAGDMDAAEQGLRQALRDADAEDVPRLRVRLVRLLAVVGRLEEAETEKDLLPEGSTEYAALAAFLFFVTEQRALAAPSVLEQRYQADAQDPEARFGLGVHAVLADDYRAASEHLFALLLQSRAYRDGIAQQALVALLALMGAEHPEAKGLRRRMFSLLH